MDGNATPYFTAGRADWGLIQDGFLGRHQMSRRQVLFIGGRQRWEKEGRTAGAIKSIQKAESNPSSPMTGECVIEQWIGLIVWAVSWQLGLSIAVGRDLLGLPAGELTAHASHATPMTSLGSCFFQHNPSKNLAALATPEICAHIQFHCTYVHGRLYMYTQTETGCARQGGIRWAGRDCAL